MKPTWQLPVKFVTPNLALQEIVVSKAQMWNHLSSSLFLLVGALSPTQRSLSRQQLDSSPIFRSAQICLSFCQVKEEESWKTTNKSISLVPQKLFTLENHRVGKPILKVHAESSQRANPHTGKIQGEPNGALSGSGVICLMFHVHLSTWLQGVFRV